MPQACAISSYPSDHARHFKHLHISASLDRLGGVETIVKLILRHDSASAVISLLDCAKHSKPMVFNLRINRLTGAAEARKQLKQANFSADALIFHNFAGMSLLSGSIPHKRALLYQHTNSDDVFDLLPQRLKYLDAILTSGNDLATDLKKRFPDISIPIKSIEYPLSEMFFGVAPETKNKRLVLGYSGRLEAEQKQVGRLVALCTHLDTQGIDYQLEIAGTGSQEKTLRGQLKGKGVRFFGRLSENELSETYKKWDFLICTSDFETGPLVVLEAMAAGVMPIMPDIPCQASALLRDHGLPLYPKSQMAAAAELIRTLIAADGWRDRKLKIRELVAGRRPEIFLDKFTTEVGEILQAKSQAERMPVRRGFYELLPFSIRCHLSNHGFFLQ